MVENKRKHVHDKTLTCREEGKSRCGRMRGFVLYVRRVNAMMTVVKLLDLPLIAICAIAIREGGSGRTGTLMVPLTSTATGLHIMEVLGLSGGRARSESRKLQTCRPIHRRF